MSTNRRNLPVERRNLGPEQPQEVVPPIMELDELDARRLEGHPAFIQSSGSQGSADTAEVVDDLSGGIPDDAAPGSADAVFAFGC
jgi:hypothetical protein